MTFLLPFIVSLTLTLLATPLTIKLAKKYKLLDDPKLRPHPAHIQNRIVPRAGGLPVYIGIVLAILIFVPLDKHILGIILGMSILLVVGLMDDFLKNFSPYPRLLIQIAAAGIVVASGVGISYITNPLGGGVIRLDTYSYPINFFGQHNLIIIADLFAFFWIVWMMNMVNWSKGVDGQMPGIVTAASLTIGLLSLKLFFNGDVNQGYIAIISFITAGAFLGFLIFNWYPSKILPGFSASTIAGFLVAVLSILSGAKLATALLVLLIPSIDFFYTFIRRVVTGKSPFYGDQKHLHHLLLKKGWSHQRISLFYISSCVILGLISTYLSSQEKLFVVLAVGTAALGGILWLQNFSQERSKKSIES